MMLLEPKEIEAIYVTNLGGNVDDLNVAKAQARKIALELQIIHSIPDPKICDRKMGEFIKKLMEEVG